MKRPYKKNSGLTLLELMIATAITIVALCGLLAIFTSLFSLNETAKNLTVSTVACQDKMEEIRNADFATLYTTYNGTNFDPFGFQLQEAKGDVYIDNTDPDLLAVYVSVSWTDHSNRIIGEDSDLDGSLDTGEDLNGDGRLSSPAEIATLIGAR
ncbi:MAG: hypothetical protein QGI05_03855 [Candidatus Omnitrophota bacterium]|jgi:type II secretory pathway pseudopilin PulG|nr:hypothetical protein [Candidatus Omnitrophota bacterium]